MSLKAQRFRVEDALKRLYETATSYAEKRCRKFMKKNDDGDGKMTVEELQGVMDPDEIADLNGDDDGMISEAELLDFFGEKSRAYLVLIGDNKIDECPKFFQYPANRLLVTLKLSSLKDQEAFLKAVDDNFDETGSNPKKTMEALDQSSPHESLKERIRSVFAAISWTADCDTDNVFDKYDDGSGFLNAEECSVVPDLTKIPFAEIDDNGSGFLSYGELRDWYQEQTLNDFKAKNYAKEIGEARTNLSPAFTMEGGDALEAAMEEKADSMMDPKTDHETVLDELVALLSEEDAAKLAATPFTDFHKPPPAPSGAGVPPPKKGGGCCGCC